MNQRGDDVHEEQEEALVIPVPDAVVHPRAVVVHAQDAPLALAAVVRPRRLILAALFAEPRASVSFALHQRVLIRPRLLRVRERRPARGHLPGVAEHAAQVHRESQRGVRGEDELVRRELARVVGPTVASRRSRDDVHEAADGEHRQDEAVELPSQRTREALRPRPERESAARRGFGKDRRGLGGGGRGGGRHRFDRGVGSLCDRRRGDRSGEKGSGGKPPARRPDRDATRADVWALSGAWSRTCTRSRTCTPTRSCSRTRGTCLRGATGAGREVSAGPESEAWSGGRDDSVVVALADRISRGGGGGPQAHRWRRRS